MKTCCVTGIMIFSACFCEVTGFRSQAGKRHKGKVKNMQQLQEYPGYDLGKPVLISGRCFPDLIGSDCMHIQTGL